MRNDKWMKGEFFFRALVNLDNPNVIYAGDPPRPRGWALSPEFFPSEQEAKARYGICKWPAEDLDGVIFCPDEEELK